MLSVLRLISVHDGESPGSEEHNPAIRYKFVLSFN